MVSLGIVGKSFFFFLPVLFRLFRVALTHLEGQPLNKGSLERPDPWANPPSPPKKTKLDSPFRAWMGGKLSLPARLGCADAAGWTWGWCINPDPWANLDILLPDASSPAVDSGIPARPIHHRSTGFLILGRVRPQFGAPAFMFLVLWLKQQPPPLVHFKPCCFPVGREVIWEWDAFAHPDTLFHCDTHTLPCS